VVIVGLIIVIVGFVLVLNLGRAADSFAAMARGLPGWMTWPWTASAAYYRCVGALFVAMGAFLLGAGLRA
jgi:hypothetical protein